MGGAPSLLFQRVGPLLYYFKGGGPAHLSQFHYSLNLMYNRLLMVINFRFNYCQIVQFQV